MSSTDSRVCCAGFCLLASIALFFGLLFGILLPELRKQTFTRTSCSLTNSTIVPNYCCSQSCQGFCSTLSSPQPTCTDRKAYLESLNPLTCSSPSCMGSMTCDGGYQCCATYCSTCSSCSTNSKGQQSCTTYSCNCFCSVATYHLACSISCNQCYTLVLTFSYEVETSGGGQLPTSSSVKTSYGTNLVAAEQALQANENYNSIYTCWYDPSNPTDVRLDITISQGVVAAFIVCGLIPLLLSITFVIVVARGDDEPWMRSLVVAGCFVMGTYIVSMTLFGIYKSYPYLYFAQAFLGACLLIVVMRTLYVNYDWYKVPVAKQLPEEELHDALSEEPAESIPQAQYAEPVPEGPSPAPVSIAGLNGTRYKPETDEEEAPKPRFKPETDGGDERKPGYGSSLANI